MLYGTDENGVKYIEGLDYEPGLYLHSDPTRVFSDYYVPYHLLEVDREESYGLGVYVRPFCPVWNVVKKEPAEDGEGQRIYIKLNYAR